MSIIINIIIRDHLIGNSFNSQPTVMRRQLMRSGRAPRMRIHVALATTHHPYSTRTHVQYRFSLLLLVLLSLSMRPVTIKQQWPPDKDGGSFLDQHMHYLSFEII